MLQVDRWRKVVGVVKQTEASKIIIAAGELSNGQFPEAIKKTEE